jgi:hypothetical protein
MAVNPTRRRRLLAGADATLRTGLIVVALVFAAGLAARFRVRLDLGLDQSSALQPDTRHKLGQLDGGPNVLITAFTSQPGRPDAALKDQRLHDLLDEIDLASDAVAVRWVDFDRDRLTAEQLGVTEYGVVVLQRDAQRVDLHDRVLFQRDGGPEGPLAFTGEAALARALAQLLSDRRRVVYALVGHGEPDVADAGPDGLAELRRLLATDHVELRPLDLARDRQPDEAPRVPQDAAAVLVVGPTAPVPATEDDVLAAALGRGVPFLVALDTGSTVPPWMAPLGIELGDGWIMDPVRVFPWADRPIPRTHPHPVTADLARGALVTVLPRVAPLVPAVPARDGIVVHTLLASGQAAWTERGGAVVDGIPAHEPAIDGPLGTLPMALAVEVGPASGLVARGDARLIVLGDADGLRNATLAEGPGNPTFAMNAVRWLMRDEAALSVMRPPAAARRLALTRTQLDTLRAGALAYGPLVALAAAWLARFLRRER